MHRTRASPSWSKSKMERGVEHEPHPWQLLAVVRESEGELIFPKSVLVGSSC